MADALQKPCTIQGAICARESARRSIGDCLEADLHPSMQNSLSGWNGVKKGEGRYNAKFLHIVYQKLGLFSLSE